MNPPKKIAIKETKKRFAIIENLKASLHNLPEAILVGGSLGYGSNLAVKRTSDIDLSIIINSKDIEKISKTSYLKGKIPEKVISLFKKRKINMIWLIISVDHIYLHIFLYEKNSYASFLTLKKSLAVFTKDIIIPKAFNRTRFNGKIIQIPSKAKPFLNGQIYLKPNLYKNRYYCDPARFDFLYSYKIISQKGNFISNLEKSYWKSLMKQFLKEYPHPNLEKESPLNTHIIHTITPWRVPQSVIEKIIERTKLELAKI